jgi:hypothetical protein
LTRQTCTRLHFPSPTDTSRLPVSAEIDSQSLDQFFQRQRWDKHIAGQTNFTDVLPIFRFIALVVNRIPDAFTGIRGRRVHWHQTIKRDSVVHVSVPSFFPTFCDPSPVFLIFFATCSTPCPSVSFNHHPDPVRHIYVASCHFYGIDYHQFINGDCRTSEPNRAVKA